MADRRRENEWAEVKGRRNKRRSREFPPSSARRAPSTRPIPRPHRYRQHDAPAAEVRPDSRARAGRSRSTRDSGEFQRSREDRRFHRGATSRSRTNGGRTRYAGGSGGLRWDTRVTGPHSTDPAFSHRTRMVFRILQAAHHLDNVAGPEPPASLAQITANLSSGINPAAPNAETVKLLQDNAKQWQETTIYILRGHYERSMQNDIDMLSQMSGEHWCENFEVAAAWARRHFGRKLKTTTVDGTRAALMQKLGDRFTDRPTVVGVQQPPAAVTRDMGSQTTPPAITTMEVGSQATLDPSPPLRASQPTAEVQVLQRGTVKSVSTTTATMTDHGEDCASGQQQETDVSSPPSPPSFLSTPPPSPSSLSPPLHPFISPSPPSSSPPALSPALGPQRISANDHRGASTTKEPKTTIRDTIRTILGYSTDESDHWEKTKEELLAASREWDRRKALGRGRKLGPKATNRATIRTTEY